MQINGFLMS